jgi:hypothetical protein
MFKVVKIRVSVHRIKIQMHDIYFLVGTNEPEIGDEYIMIDTQPHKLLWVYHKIENGSKVLESMIKKRKGLHYI